MGYGGRWGKAGWLYKARRGRVRDGGGAGGCVCPRERTGGGGDTRGGGRGRGERAGGGGRGGAWAGGRGGAGGAAAAGGGGAGGGVAAGAARGGGGGGGGGGTVGGAWGGGGGWGPLEEKRSIPVRPKEGLAGGRGGAFLEQTVSVRAVGLEREEWWSVGECAAGLKKSPRSHWGRGRARGRRRGGGLL